MGIFGSRGRSPTRGIAGLDAGASGLIDKSTDRADRSLDDYQAEQNQYNSSGESFAQTPQMVQQEQARSGGDGPMMGQAIRSRYNQVANQDIQRLRYKNDMKARMTKSDDMKKTFHMQMARQNIMNGSLARLAEANLQAADARANILMQVLGAGGMAAGMYAGGMFDNKNVSISGSGVKPSGEAGLGWGSGGEGQGGGIDSSGLGWG